MLNCMFLQLLYLLTNQLSDEFKRSVYWTSYQNIPARVLNQGTNIYELLVTSFQGIKILFVRACFVATDYANNEAGIKDKKNYFLPRG